MNKKEKIIAIIFILSFFSVIFSSFYTMIKLRPKNGFMIEYVVKNKINPSLTRF